MSIDTLDNDTTRLEQLWARDFGNAYVERNREAWVDRGPFWQDVAQRYPFASALEIGCNVGGNLKWLAGCDRQIDLTGIDVNGQALEELRSKLPQVTTLQTPGRDLPFADGSFDLTFTMGVLIHVSPESLSDVMSEIVRCSKRFVLCGEYFAEQTVEVPYRGHEGALYKRNFGQLYAEQFPERSLLETGFLPKGEGFDDVTFWIFEKDQG